MIGKVGGVRLFWLACMLLMLLAVSGCGPQLTEQDRRNEKVKAEQAHIHDKMAVMPDWYRSRLEIDATKVNRNWLYGDEITVSLWSYPLQYAAIALLVACLLSSLVMAGSGQSTSFGEAIVGLSIMASLGAGVLAFIYWLGVNLIWSSGYYLPWHYALTLGVGTIVIGPMLLFLLFGLAVLAGASGRGSSYASSSASPAQAFVQKGPQTRSRLITYLNEPLPTSGSWCSISAMEAKVGPHRGAWDLRKWAQALQDWHEMVEGSLHAAQQRHNRGQGYVAEGRTSLATAVAQVAPEITKRGLSVSPADIAAAKSKLSIGSRFEYPKFARPKHMKEFGKQTGMAVANAARVAMNNPNPATLIIGAAIIAGATLFEASKRSKEIRKLEELQGELGVFTQEAANCFMIIEAAEREAKRMVGMFVDAAKELDDAVNIDDQTLLGRVCIAQALLQIEGLAR